MSKFIQLTFYGWSWRRWTFGISIGNVVGQFGIDFWLGPCNFAIMFGKCPWEIVE